jgi:hypothetical protein
VGDLVVATFLTTRFGEWRSAWHGRVADDRRSGAPMLEEVPRQNEGALVVFDYDTGQPVWSLTLDTPAGFAFGDEHLYLNSMYGNRILIIDRNLNVIDSISLRFMNDLHSLVEQGGSLIITSSGVDAVVRLDLDGRLQWSWFATDSPYRWNAHGTQPRRDRRADYRSVPIRTTDQTTHCNSAVPAILDGREVVLVSLFHQGEVIAVDCETKSHDVLVTGLCNPHSIRRRDGGWLVSDSRSGCVVLLDDRFWIQEVIEGDFDWVQDAVELGADRLLVADANHSRLVEWDLMRVCVVREVRYADEWKVYQVEIAKGAWRDRLREAIARAASARADGA